VDPATFLTDLRTAYEECKSKIIAIGECGLDYDRFNYADKETQLAVFPPHFDLAEETGLPMYLHCRATEGDFMRIVRENRHRFNGGVVHSFTGTAEEL
jgi:TatD DNase family protein